MTHKVAVVSAPAASAARSEALAAAGWTVAVGYRTREADARRRSRPWNRPGRPA